MQLNEGLLIDSVFEPRMRRWTCQRLLGVIEFALGGCSSGSDLKSQIVLQLLMLVGVLVASNDAQNSASMSLGQRMGDKDLFATFGDDLVDSANQLEPAMEYLKQHHKER